MPIYEFINTETEEVFEKVVPLGDFDQYLKDNPHIKRHYSSAPQIISKGAQGALSKAGDGWKEVQDKVKAGLPPRLRDNIKTK